MDNGTDSMIYVLLSVADAPGPVAAWVPRTFSWIPIEGEMFGCADVGGELVPWTFVYSDIQRVILE